MSNIMDFLAENERENQKKLDTLKKLIDNNEQPTILACSHSSSNDYTFGDLVDIGYASKQYICDSQGEVEDIEWFYNGPNSVNVTMVIGDGDVWVVEKNNMLC